MIKPEEPRRHIPTKHEACDRPACMICDGGLVLCTVCGALEGALTSECAGVVLTPEQIEAVYAGEIDFKAGAWTAPGSEPWARTILIAE